MEWPGGEGVVYDDAEKNTSQTSILTQTLQLILPRRRRERGYQKHARISYQKPHSIGELGKEPQGF